MFLARAAYFSQNSSYTARSTRIREPAVQRSPLSEKTPNRAGRSRRRGRRRRTQRTGTCRRAHGQALEVGRGVAEDRLAGGGFAGEGDQRDVRVLDQGVAGFLAEAVDQVEHTVRQAGVLEDLRPQRGGERGELGRLEDHGVAGGQGGASFQFQHERRVPRRDEARDADRLAVHVVDLRAGDLHGVVELGHDQVREEAEVLGRAQGLALGLGDGQAGVEGFELGQALLLGFDGVGDLVQDAGAFAASSSATGRW